MGPQLPLALVAIAMALVTARLVLWAAESRTRLKATVVVFLLTMMAAMFLGILLYADDPNVGGFVLGLWVAAVVMAVSVFPVVSVFAQELLRRVGAGDGYAPQPLGSVGGLAATVAAVVLVAELFMGRAFAILAGDGGGAVAAGAGGLLELLERTLASPWFALPMSLEMAASWYWLRPRLGRTLSGALLAQAGAMGLAPPLVASPVWVALTGVASGAIMVALYVFLGERLFGARAVTEPLARYATLLVVLFAVMAGGLLAWALTGSIALFGASEVALTALFFSSVVGPERLAEPAEAAGRLAGPASAVPPA